MHVYNDKIVTLLNMTDNLTLNLSTVIHVFLIKKDTITYQ